MEEPMTSRQVGLNGFEPLTSRLSGVRSNRLSYSPNSCTYRLLSSNKKSVSPQEPLTFLPLAGQLTE